MNLYLREFRLKLFDTFWGIYYNKTMIDKVKESLLENSFAKSIIELKLLSDRIVEGKGAGSGIFTIKYQMLYLIASKTMVSPQELISQLNMAKSNLTLMAKKMIKEGLIVQTKTAENRKQIYYSITESGREELSVKMKAIENVYGDKSKEMLNHLKKTVDTLKNVK